MRVAWFGASHPGEAISCSECGVAARLACRSTLPFSDHGAVGVPIAGIHAARVAEALDREASGLLVTASVAALIAGAA